MSLKNIQKPNQRFQKKCV